MGTGDAAMNKTHSSVIEFTIFGGREKLMVIISEMSDRKGEVEIASVAKTNSRMMKESCSGCVI